MAGFFSINLNASISSDRHLTVANYNKKRDSPKRTESLSIIGARDENRTRTETSSEGF